MFVCVAVCFYGCITFNAMEFSNGMFESCYFDKICSQKTLCKKAAASTFFSFDRKL